MTVAISSEPKFEELLARIERREATSRRRTVLLSIIPVVIAAVVLGGMTLGVRTLSQRSEVLRVEADGYRKAAGTAQQELARQQEEVKKLQQRVDELEEQLRRTTDVARFRHDINFVDLKMIASRSPAAARALELILALRERRVGWRLGGRSPDEGFDSPSFAAYVLRQRLPASPAAPATTGTDLIAASRALMQTLPRTDAPGVGDLVFYPAGYALFRFEDGRGRPFVIGMTPQGIVALKPEFSEPVGAARIRW